VGADLTLAQVNAWLPEIYLDLQRKGWTLSPGQTPLRAETPGLSGFETAQSMIPNLDSGSLSTSVRRFIFDAPIQDWTAEQCDGRTFHVNGIEVTPGGKLPPPMGGKYYFRFGAGGIPRPLVLPSLAYLSAPPTHPRLHHEAPRSRLTRPFGLPVSSSSKLAHLSATVLPASSKRWRSLDSLTRLCSPNGRWSRS
jgi:hypothetical protein